MKRLELVRVRTCGRCGRGTAVLRCEGGETLNVPLDPERTAQLTERADGGLRTLSRWTLAHLRATGVVVHEVVLDAEAGRLRALLSLEREGEADVLACTPGEGVALAVLGGLAVYATDDALAQAAARAGKTERETLH